jgi:hypothetical protein
MADGPKPFSSEWITAPPQEPEPPHLFSDRIRTMISALAGKLPGERSLSIWVVLILGAGSLWMAGPQGQAHLDQLAALQVDATPTPVIDWQQEGAGSSSASISTDSLDVAENQDGLETVQPTPPQLQLDAPQTANSPTLTPDGLLPGHRILTFYGFPGDANMGILGEYDMETVLAQLREQAAAYEAADPSRPVLIAFEVIASVAQKEPQADGSYLLDTPSEVLDEYAAFTAENDILLFLDVQIGRRTVQAEVEGLRPWLEQPHVHLALDPEFAMREGELPGEHIGQIDASDIAFTQQYLANLSAELDIPPKVLIVHQFIESMIENKDQVVPVAGVQLVIDSDGWGTPADKRATYDAVNGCCPIEFDGVKLFYQQDVPLMTPEEVLDLDPVPDVIIYQ